MLWCMQSPGAIPCLTSRGKYLHCAAGTEPVMNVSVHTEGRYAFVELRTSEMATASLQLNGQASGWFGLVGFSR